MFVLCNFKCAVFTQHRRESPFPLYLQKLTLTRKWLPKTHLKKKSEKKKYEREPKAHKNVEGARRRFPLPVLFFKEWYICSILLCFFMFISISVKIKCLFLPETCSILSASRHNFYRWRPSTECCLTVHWDCDGIIDMHFILLVYKHKYITNKMSHFV